MHVEMIWPSGGIASFDGSSWATEGVVPVSADVLLNLPSRWSHTIPDWEFWHGVDVAELMGAEVTTAPPSSDPNAVSDVARTPDELLEEEPTGVDDLQEAVDRAAARGHDVAIMLPTERVEE